uniref:Uncharacterized protein n=1 Tax=Heterorhabditis bacteriophora TaxID=37862 RepID=A0A1I7XC39_HETBA
MFLAIINDSYVEVKAELTRKIDGEGIIDWIKRVRIKTDYCIYSPVLINKLQMFLLK